MIKGELSETSLDWTMSYLILKGIFLLSFSSGLLLLLFVLTK